SGLLVDGATLTVHLDDDRLEVRAVIDDEPSGADG
ncbi:MAG: hypothetical protein ACI9BK_003530, partial [Acidimicrobiales bacterium]